MQLQILAALPPLKFGGAKNVQKSVRILTAFELSANISGTDKDNDKI